MKAEPQTATASVAPETVAPASPTGAAPPGAVLALQRTVGNQAVSRALVARDKDKKPVATPVDRNEVELLAAKLKVRQSEFSSFLGDATRDVGNIRAHYAWVNGVYERCHEHYAMVIAQAGADVDSTQKWVDFMFGVATGVAVGLASEFLIAGAVAETVLETVAEVGAEMVEGGIASVVKPEVPKPMPDKDLAPEFKKIRALENLDKINQVVLNLAVPGPMVYAGAINESAQLSQELRVMELGGEPKLTEMEMRDRWLKIMSFSLQSLRLEQAIQDLSNKLVAIRAKYSSIQPPTDARCEQDIWIPWLARQEAETLFFTPTLLHPQIVRHLADIGLVGWDTPGGRLNIKVHYHASNPFGDSPSDVLDPDGTEDATAKRLKAAAGAAQGELPAYWANMFLF